MYFFQQCDELIEKFESKWKEQQEAEVILYEL